MFDKNHGGLLTVADVAEYLQCGTTTVEAWIKNGQLRRVSLSPREVGDRKGPRGPKLWRIRPEALREFIMMREGREVPPGEPKQASGVPMPRLSLPYPTGPDGKRRLKLPKNSLP